MYINVHSYYSYRYGTIPVKELLVQAQELGITSFALTDINNTSASLDFIRLSEKCNIKPIVGIDFRNGAQQQFIGLAKNNLGFESLNRFLTLQLQNGSARTVDLARDGVVCPDEAPFFENVYIIYPYQNIPNRTLRDYEYIGIRPSELNQLMFAKRRDILDKLVILQSVTFRTKADFNAHRLLRAIDNNTLLSKLDCSEEGDVMDRMIGEDELIKRYERYPEIIENTKKIIAECHIEFEFGNEHPHKNQQTYTGSLEGDNKLIKDLCAEGLTYRYGSKPSEEILERLKNELEIITKKNFTAYFLINWDIVSHARSKGYFYVGRGSGANSIVAYLLCITDVDPIDLDLYFERFINLYRQNPPDFDIDFSWRDRDDVIEYIFNRFTHVSLLATYSTFQKRSVVRELGKVFGLPKSEIDRLSSGNYNAKTLDHLSQLVLRYGDLIHGFPSHLSIHAGGILISEKPSTHYTATFMPPKGFATTQFDMIVAEDVGLYKFDILSQRGLGKIKDTVDIIEKNRPKIGRIDIHDIKKFKQDETIRGLLKTGKAIGCFYVESPAMRMLLKKLKVDNYLGLVAASSIIRPGVAKSGMMREYILRYRYPERRKEAHPVMLEIMPETYGVMVYQEDVIKVAHIFAGLTLGEADVLRRGMSGKFRSREEFQKAKAKFFSNCKEKGYTDELTAEIWRQTESFAGYAFSKGHSASYAVESYQSLFLKAHFPLEYMVAVINNFGGFYQTELYVHEARMHGGIVEAPCINKSKSFTTIEGRRIYLGLGMISELTSDSIERILVERHLRGTFCSFSDFVKRTALSLDQLTLLIRIGAFRFTERQKKALMWEAYFLTNGRPKIPTRNELFEVPTKTFKLPDLYAAPLENAFEEMELLGFPLCHPFLLTLERMSICLAEDFKKYCGKEVVIAGYLVAIKNTSTSNNRRMNFGTFLDAKGHFIDTTHFPPVAEKYPFRGRGIYHIKGLVVEEFGFYSIEVRAMKKLAVIEDPRYAEEKNKTKNFPLRLKKSTRIMY